MEKKQNPYLWGCSSAGRAPALQAGGHGFESHHLHQVIDIGESLLPTKRIRRGNGTEQTSGGRLRPWKTERVVRARIESHHLHQARKAGQPNENSDYLY